MTLASQLTKHFERTGPAFELFFSAASSGIIWPGSVPVSPLHQPLRQPREQDHLQHVESGPQVGHFSRIKKYFTVTKGKPGPATCWHTEKHSGLQPFWPHSHLLLTCIFTVTSRWRISWDKIPAGWRTTLKHFFFVSLCVQDWKEEDGHSRSAGSSAESQEHWHQPELLLPSAVHQRKLEAGSHRVPQERSSQPAVWHQEDFYTSQ